MAERLRENVARVARRSDTAAVDVRQIGLSATAGTAQLLAHADASSNHGLAFIGTGEGGVSIRTERLDDVIGADTVGVMKLDVEGHEPAVLAGTGELLARKGVRNVVFEDHAISTSPVRGVFASAGYRVYALGWRMAGPVLADPDGPSVCQPYEPPSYLATAEPEDVEQTMKRPGWELFR